MLYSVYSKIVNRLIIRQNLITLKVNKFNPNNQITDFMFIEQERIKGLSCQATKLLVIQTPLHLHHVAPKPYKDVYQHDKFYHRPRCQ